MKNSTEFSDQPDVHIVYTPKKKFPAFGVKINDDGIPCMDVMNPRTKEHELIPFDNAIKWIEASLYLLKNHN